MKSHHAALAALAALAPTLAVFVACACAFLVNVPAHEGPDEPGHHDYAFQYERTGERPWVPGTTDGVRATHWHESSMAHHPVLYYAVLAGLGRVMDGGLAAPTPQFEEGRAPYALRHGHDEVAPRSDEVRAFFVLRGFSVVCGALSLVLLWATVRRLAPNSAHAATLATGLLACLPQWQYAHAVLDNGALGTLLCFAALFVLARVWTFADERRAVAVSWFDALALGLAIGAALATKLTALFLFAPAAAAAVRVVWRSERRAVALVRCGAALALALAALAPFVLENEARYGEPLARGVHAEAYEVSSIAHLAQQVGMELGEARRVYLTQLFPQELGHSLVGVFGSNAVSVPDHSLWGWGAAALLGVVGLVLGRGTPWRAVALAAPVLALGLAQVVAYNLDFKQAQGRYLFPAVGALALVVGAGLAALAARSKRGAPVFVFALLAAAAVDALHTAFVVVPRAYSASPAADPLLAAFCGSIGVAPHSADASIDVHEPADGARLVDSPTFVFDVPAERVVTLHLWLEHGPFMGGTFETLRADVNSGRWSLPPDLWASLPVGSRVFWQVRVVPDRMRGEAALDVPRSAPRSLVRE